jgi:hypothetical protein
MLAYPRNALFLLKNLFFSVSAARFPDVATQKIRAEKLFFC